MSSETVVHTHGARDKPFFLCILDSFYIAHELIHDVSVLLRRAESVFSHHPARGEDRKVAHCHSGFAAGVGQHSENAGVGVVETHRRYYTEFCQILPLRLQITIPCNYVEGGVIVHTFEELTHVLFVDNLLIFRGRVRVRPFLIF